MNDKVEGQSLAILTCYSELTVLYPTVLLIITYVCKVCCIGVYANHKKNDIAFINLFKMFSETSPT